MESNTKSQPRKSKRKSPSKRQRLFFKFMAENGGNASDAARKAGYSETMVNNPQRITGSRAYKEILDLAGLDDARLAAIHSEMANAVKVETVFYAAEEKRTKKGKLLGYCRIPDPEEIKQDIDARYPGRNYTLIEAKNGSGITAYVQIPEHHHRGRALELAYKSKGHMAPEVPGNIVIPATDEEKKAVAEALGLVKK